MHISHNDDNNNFMSVVIEFL